MITPQLLQCDYPPPFFFLNHKKQILRLDEVDRDLMSMFPWIPASAGMTTFLFVNSFFLNCCNFCNSCRFVQFTGFENIFTLLHLESFFNEDSPRIYSGDMSHNKNRKPF